MSNPRPHDISSIVDSAGTIQASYYYNSYGVMTESTGSVNNSITYAGYTYDTETGLYYLKSRMYNPNSARFMQEDTYNGDAASVLSLNIYVYCTNNPLTYYDPYGDMGLVQALDWVLAYLDSLVNWSFEDFIKNYRRDTRIPDPLSEKFESMFSNLEEYREEVALVAFTAVLIIGGVMMMPECPAIGSGLINAGTSIAATGFSDFKEDGEINYSVMEYAKVGFAGFASGTISGGIAKYGISIGLKGVSNSVFASVGDMAGNAATQYILTGKVDPKIMIVSGATSFVCAEGIRNAAKVVTPKSLVQTASKSAAPDGVSTSTSKGGGKTVDVELKYKDGWTTAQKAEADAKVKALTETNTLKTQPVRSGTSASSRYKSAYSATSVPRGYDVDHTIDLQLGGADDILNMNPLDLSVNRSLGVQIKNAIKDYDIGTIFDKFIIK